MKRQLRAWILTGALVLGALFFWLRQDARPPEAAGPPLLSSPEVVRAFRLLPPGAPALVLEREGAAFRLTAPVETAADGERVRTLLEQLCALGPGEAVERGEKPLSVFGLDPAAFELELTTDAGPLRLALGGESPFDGRSYLLVDGEGLLLVSSALRHRLDPRLLHWREKRVVTTPPEQLDLLHWKEGEVEIALEKLEAGWTVVDPAGGTSAPAGDLPRRALIRDLGELRAVAFEVEGPALPAADAEPEAVLSLGLRGEGGGRSQRRTLELFALAADGEPGVLLRGSELSPWVRLRPGALADLRERFGALRPAPEPAAPGPSD
ncbi:MAG: DUF4340 domain-containing protein [Deltaproteobacteria bacterium]|nr:DUF4340 domain-containing protein [Deltaproteobacteria bacterium]